MSNFIISGFADEISPDLDIQTEVLNSLGIEYIELRGIDGKNISTYNEDGFKSIKKRLDGKGIKVSSIGSPIGKIKITDDFAPDLESFKNMLSAAIIFGTKYIRVFSFYMPDGSDYDTFRDTVMERWQRYVEVAQGSGIVLCHENEKGIYGDNAKRCLDIMKVFERPSVRSVFDPANFVQVGQDTKDAYKLLAPYIEYIHIKDALSKDSSVVPAGFGDGNVEYILSNLNKSGFNNFASLEPHLGKFVGFAALEEGLDTTKMTTDSGSDKFILAYNSLKSIIEKI